MTVEKPAAERTLLGEVRRQRAELRAALGDLEQALAGPAPGNLPLWSQGVRDAMDEVADAFSEHVDVTEGADGLYEDLLQAAPRLTGDVARLIEEHKLIAARIDGLLDNLAGLRGSEDVARVRDLGTALLDTLMRHRQRGSDLIYEAYEAEIGGET